MGIRFVVFVEIDTISVLAQAHSCIVPWICFFVDSFLNLVLALPEWSGRLCAAYWTCSHSFFPALLMFGGWFRLALLADSYLIRLGFTDIEWIYLAALF